MRYREYYIIGGGGAAAGDGAVGGVANACSIAISKNISGCTAIGVCQ